MKDRILPFLTVLLALAPLCSSITAVSPAWVASSYFKAGGVTFTYTGGSSNQNLTVTYSSAMVNSTLKVPTLGITDLNYLIVSGQICLLIKVVKYTSTYLTFNVEVNVNAYLSTLKLTYMALDNSFTPAFSMNYFFPNVAKTGPNFTYQAFVNFTSSTGVTLNTSHENVLLPFLHYIDLVTSDSTVNINLNFSLCNGSFYSVIISSTSKMTLKYAGFSRLIFDKTVIEAMGNDYFDYGIVDSLKNNATALSTVIPPDIIPSNLFYGMHSFNIQTGLSQLNYISSYNISSGAIGYNSQGTYVYQQMKFSYIHHKTRTCPASNPYYNLTEMLCYDQCAVGWYADISTMTCKQCLYDCLACTSGTTCSTCDSTTDKRQLVSLRCAALPGYYDDGTNNPIAQPCSSPCMTCVTSATYCLSCNSGYYLSGSICLSCSAAIPSCTTCTNSTFCTLCSGGGNGTTCTSCTANQYLNAANTCITCSSVIANCQSCTSSTQCTLCKTSFTLYSGTNCSCASNQYLSNSTCNACSSAVSYCAACTSANNCTSCAATFTLFSSINCACGLTSYLDPSTSQCQSCTLVVPYCLSCTNTNCTACMTTFTLSNGACICSNGTYANSTNSACESCSVIAHCLACTNAATCTSCAIGYKVNSTTGLCDVQPCTVSNCDTCIANSTTICQSCYSGYSVGANGALCQAYCGNYALDPSQNCDDGNVLPGDGCSSSCKIETGFGCYSQYINSSNSYSWCFYTAVISFTNVWTRKFEGNNSLKFSFQLGQQINQWATVNFTSILGVDQYDTSKNNSLGITSSIIQSYYAEYEPARNRFWVIIDYINSTMEKTNLLFSLSPYNHHTYPAFSPPNDIEFDAPVIELFTVVSANNNQNANFYSTQQYGIYSVSVNVTYFVVALAILGLLTSLAFRTAKVIAFEMITIMQITYFSLAFLDSMSPVFSGMLPLRYLAGVLTFQDVQSYLEQLTSPNSMKGVYMYLHLSDNISWVALGLVCFLGLGVLLLLVYIVYDYLANPEAFQSESLSEQDKKGYWLHKLAFHFIGQLSLSLIFLCLPLYTISLFFEVFFTMGRLHFWSYAQALGIGLAILGYFIALLKSEKPKDGNISRLGQYISQFNCLGCFKTFKYCNFQIIQTLIISGFVMATIYSNSKIFSALCIVLTAVIDIMIVAVVKPYRFGFVSCCKGEDDDTEVLFQKIQLYKVYEKPQPSVLHIEQPDNTQKTYQNENNSQFFTQHFATKKNMLKSKHQGLVQAGEILNHTKLFLFNNNSRRIVNLATLIVVEFVFICTQIYASDITKSYAGVTIQNMLPLLIHIMLTFNVVYNYAMIVLQILDRRKQNAAKVGEPDSASFQLNKSMYTQANKERVKEETQQPTQLAHSSFVTTKEMYQINKLIIKSNSTAASLYDLKRPQIIRNRDKLNRKHRRNVHNQIPQN